MLSKSLKMIALIGFVSVLFSSCSEDGEIFEEQKPQSLISKSLGQVLAQSTNGNQQMLQFQEQISWYENYDPTICGVESMLLAYEVFDNDGVSLNAIAIFDWDTSYGPFSEFVSLTNEFLNDIFQQEVNIVFVSGILFKTNATSGVVEFAQIDSYTLFLDYFEDCESTEVVFQPDNGNNDWLEFLNSPEDEVEFPEPMEPSCYSLVFPLDILVVADSPNAQPFVVTVNETEFLNYLSGESTNLIILDFVYPLSLISQNGTTVTVNNIDELEQLFDQPCN